MIGMRMGCRSRRRRCVRRRPAQSAASARRNRRRRRRARGAHSLPGSAAPRDEQSGTLGRALRRARASASGRSWSHLNSPPPPIESLPHPQIVSSDSQSDSPPSFAACSVRSSFAERTRWAFHHGLVGGARPLVAAIRFRVVQRAIPPSARSSPPTAASARRTRRCCSATASATGGAAVDATTGAGVGTSTGGARRVLLHRQQASLGSLASASTPAAASRRQRAVRPRRGRRHARRRRRPHILPLLGRAAGEVLTRGARVAARPQRLALALELRAVCTQLLLERRHARRRRQRRLGVGPGGGGVGGGTSRCVDD